MDIGSTLAWFNNSDLAELSSGTTTPVTPSSQISDLPSIIHKEQYLNDITPITCSFIPNVYRRSSLPTDFITMGKFLFFLFNVFTSEHLLLQEK